jgi:hypothetical protein
MTRIAILGGGKFNQNKNLNKIAFSYVKTRLKNFLSYVL